MSLRQAVDMAIQQRMQCLDLSMSEVTDADVGVLVESLAAFVTAGCGSIVLRRNHITMHGLRLLAEGLQVVPGIGHV